MRPHAGKSIEVRGLIARSVTVATCAGVQESVSDHAGTVEALLDAGAPMPDDPGEVSDPVRDVLRRYNRRG